MREHWSWPGAVALALAVLLGAGWCTALILVASPIGEPIGDVAADLLATVGGVMAGALATFLGAAMQRREPLGRERDTDRDGSHSNPVP